jgi:hypothetical protein
MSAAIGSATSFVRCRLPVAGGLCRLPKGHPDECDPGSEAPTPAPVPRSNPVPGSTRREYRPARPVSVKPQPQQAVQFNCMREAEAERARLVDQLHSLELQIVDPDLKDEAGNRLGTNEYFAWRRWAAVEKVKATRRLSAVKAWIKATNLEGPARALGLDPNSADQLVAAAGDLLKRLYREGVELDEDEVRLMDACRNYAGNGGKR